MTRVLVVGGTNFIGPEVARGLAREGAEVTVLHRGDHEDDLGDIRHVHTDRGDLARVAAELAPEVIVDMAPITAEHGASVVAAAEAAGASRVVAVSSVDTYRGYDVVHGRDDTVQQIPFRETDPVRRHRYPYRDRFEPGEAMYDYDKLDVEEHVLGSSDVEGVVLRLPVVFGPKDRQHRLYPILARIADGMDVIVMTEGMGAWRFGKSFRSNVADAIVLGSLHPAANGVYNVGTFAGTEAEWARMVGEAMAWSGEVVLIPDADAPPELHPGIDVRQHLVCDPTRIRSELGWNERVGLADAIRITATWELANPPDGFTYDREAELAAAGR